jgi:outer membrane lipoprotein-sorting protein
MMRRALHEADVTIAPMTPQRVGRAAARRIVVMCALCAAATASTVPGIAQRAPAEKAAFDDLYRRGQLANGRLKTLTARFTETTTSGLLTRPLVERGTLAVERPAKVVMNYVVPETRTVLIDGDRLVLSWPGRHIHQVTNIGQMQGRVQKYFVEGDPDELRRSFDITVTDTEKRAGTEHVAFLPKRKQIREGLTQLDLWIDQSSLLLAAMRMTFANGDTKLMTLEDIVPNAPLAPGTFFLPQPTAR